MQVGLPTGHRDKRIVPLATALAPLPSSSVTEALKTAAFAYRCVTVPCEVVAVLPSPNTHSNETTGDGKPTDRAVKVTSSVPFAGLIEISALGVAEAPAADAASAVTPASATSAVTSKRILLCPSPIWSLPSQSVTLA